MNPQENLEYAVGAVCFAAMQAKPSEHEATRKRLQVLINTLPHIDIDAGYVSLLLLPVQRKGSGIAESLQWAKEALEYGESTLYPALHDDLMTLLKAIVPASTEGENALLELMTAIKACNLTPKSDTPWNSSSRVMTRLTA